MAEIREPHRRHLPRSRSHESTGRLSRAPITAPHEGHIDRPETIDSFRGTRHTTTVRNEPISRPNRAKISARVMVAEDTSPGGGSGHDLADVGEVLLVAERRAPRHRDPHEVERG